MVNYQNGKIYQLVNDVNNIVYIGSTTQSLCKRMNGHRGEGNALRHETPIYTAMREIGTEHFRILLIQNAPCNSKEELHAIEYAAMRQFKQRGVILYNSIIDGRCSAETRAKNSASQMGKTVSEATRAKLSNAIMGKNVSEATRARMSKMHTKRGYISNDKTSWLFQWRENGKRYSKTFSIKKYGYDAAHGLALYWQEEIYPIERIDDSELIREIRARVEA